MARSFNTVGGGANTNRNGLEFERGTDLREAFKEHPRYKLLGDSIIDRATDLKVGTLFEKNKLYKNLLEAHDVDYTQLVSKKLLPDDALLVGGTLHIIEKKYQAGAGSVDEKLQTCHFKLRQYTKLLAPLGIRVEFHFLLSDWFKAPSYKDVLEYICEVGCDYFFHEIPLEKLGL
ncbi:MAG: hypothetical protein ACRYF0_04045 [Janthinobacterium lividum]